MNRKKLIWIGKLSISAICLSFLIYKVQEQEVLLSSNNLPDSFTSVLALVIFLMVLNWSLEILRWRHSVNAFEEISIKGATIDVLGGLAMNWAIPLTAGDFMVRLVAKENKIASTKAVIINRVIMLIFSALFGLYGLLVFYTINLWWMYPAIALIFLSIAWYLYIQKTFSTKNLFLILGLSAFRYLIFTLQFLVLLKLFNPELSDHTLVAGIGWIFFFRTMLPSLLGGIGIREASSILFFEGLVGNLSTILFPIFLIWIVNTVLPSIFGSVLIWGLRFKIAR